MLGSNPNTSRYARMGTKAFEKQVHAAFHPSIGITDTTLRDMKIFTKGH